ncbi:nickel pincer cofactor biosynthesis protein LarC [Peptococcaceae bacterium 1198_IL3148]
MKVAYLDCFAGIAGDMIIGALLDAGLSLELLQGELKKLNLAGWQLKVEKVKKNGISGTKFAVQAKEQHHHNHGNNHNHRHRNLHDIQQIINDSNLDQDIKNTALDIFSRLAQAEAKVHGTTVEEVHFHEVGAMDAIIDIVGAAVGFHLLGIEQVMASSLTTGSGFVQCSHGTIPIPAPATAELLKGVPCQHGDINQELVTPTGAAIITSICHCFGPMPEMISETVGYGAGDGDLSIPNLLRIHIGEIKKNR